MRVDFIGHATLLMRHGGLSILSDPWWSGPAYRGQWYPYPLPVPERYDLASVDAVYISHAHEDHLHPGTLKDFLQRAPNVEAIIPRRYDTQMRDYLRRLGFKRIREVQSGQPFTLRKGTDTARLTVMTHMDDSLLAVEAGGQTLINANDALHSSRRELIVEYCRILRRRFPSLDYLFCGFGGASYFPNCIHVPGKDDRQIARAREQFFLHNFALIADRLKPRMAFPFAAHFVLPDDRNWWISASRLTMEPPAETLRRLLPSSPTVFADLAPGDYVEDGQIHAEPRPAGVPVTVAAYAGRAEGGGWRGPDGVDAAREAVLQRYPARSERKPLDAAGFEELLGSIRGALARHADAEPLDAVLMLWDYPHQAIHVEVGHGRATAQPVPAEDIHALNPQVVFETRSDLVKSTITSHFGRDLITVGYGGQVRLRSRDDMASAPHDRLLAMLAPPQPRWRERLRTAPLRTAGFLLGDPSMRLGVFDDLRRRAQWTAPDEPALYRIDDWADLAQTPE
jgi:hypothetical protein